MPQPRFDMVIRGGTIVDGTKFPRFIADLGIKDGRVAKIGRIGANEGREVIDATGLFVAPGFIDLHTHYDAQVHWDPYCTGAGWHGFTTVMTGNCGFGFAPCKPEMRERAMLMMENTEQVPMTAMRDALPWTWESFPEWLDHLRSVPKGVNLMMYMPVNPLLIYVMGIDAAKTRPATPSERAEMRRLLHEAMDAGACGFAFSRLGGKNQHVDFDGSPMPSDVMSFDEALNLAEVLRERDEGVIQVLCEMPGGEEETRRNEEALARVSGRPVIHNAIMAIDRVPDYHLNALKWLEDAHASGLRIFGQGATGRFWTEFTMHEINLWNGVAPFHKFDFADDAEKMALLEDPEWKAEARACNNDVSLMYTGPGPLDTLTLKSANGGAKWARYEGQKVAAIAEAEGRDLIDVFCEIVRDGSLDAIFVTQSIFTENPDRMMEVMGHPLVIPGTSDGGAHIKFYCGNGYSTDMLGWLVRDEKKMSLEDFHYRMSAFPARVVGLQDRGTLTVGNAADIVIYDLDAISHKLYDYDRATDLPGGEWRRVDFAQGYRYILVNGQVTFRDGRSTGATPGSVLRVTSEREPTPQLAAAE